MAAVVKVVKELPIACNRRVILKMSDNISKYPTEDSKMPNEAPTTFTPHLAGVNPPALLNLNENKVENWKLWKQQWLNYLLLSRLDSMEQRYQLAMFENRLGATALKVYNTSLTYAEGN